MAHQLPEPLPEPRVPRGMLQGNRCMVIMDVLDITYEQWTAWLEAEQDPDRDYFEIGDLIAQMIYALAHPEDPKQKSLYIQALCQLNDENLAMIVTMVTGKTYDFMP